MDLKNFLKDNKNLIKSKIVETNSFDSSKISDLEYDKCILNGHYDKCIINGHYDNIFYKSIYLFSGEYGNLNFLNRKNNGLVFNAYLTFFYNYFYIKKMGMSTLI
jgi:hypothetical protein